MSDDAKAPYVERSIADQDRYKREYEVFMFNGEVPDCRSSAYEENVARKNGNEVIWKRMRKKKLGEPRRGKTAWNLYASEQRVRAMCENPNLEFKDVSRILGAEWRAMSDEAKAPYFKRSIADKERYRRECEAWVASRVHEV